MAAGKTAQAMRDMMDEETWLDAEEATKLGLATSKNAAKAVTPTAFDYRVYVREV